MKKRKKTKKELVEELEALRVRLAELEAATGKGGQDLSCIVEEAPVLICRFLPDGTLTLVNKTYCSYFNRERAELIGQNFFQFIPEQDREKVREHFLSLDQQKPMVTYEHQVIDPEGSIRWQQWTDRAFFDENGRIKQYQSVGIDITERKQTEQSLREAKLLLEMTFASLNEAVFVVEPITRTVISCNPAVERIFGYTEEEVIGRNTEFLHVNKTKYEVFGLELFEALDKDGVYHGEFQMRRKDGTVFFTEHTVTEIVDDWGHRAGTVSVVRDITERIKVEKALRQSEEKFRLLAENIDDVFWIGSPEFDSQIYVSPAYEKVWGKTVDSLYSSPKSFMGSVHPEDRDRIIQELGSRNKRKCAAEYRVVKPDGSMRWVHDRSFPVKDEHGKTVAICGVARDITDQKVMQNKVRQSEEKYRVLAESVESPIFIHDQQGRYLYLNKCAADFVGKEQRGMLGTKLLEYFPDSDARRMLRDIRLVYTEKRSRRLEYTLLSPEGDSHFSVTLSPIFSEEGDVSMVVGVAHDITELKRAKQCLEESEARMRALLDALTESAMLVDPQGIMLVINDTAARRLGRSVEELIGLSITEYLPPEIVASRKAQGEKVLQSGKRLRFQDERQGRVYDVSLSPVPGDKGRGRGLAIFARDITEEKDLLDALKNSEQRYRTLIETMNEGVAITDKDMRLTFVNDRLCGMLGYKPEELIGQPGKKFVTGANVKVLKEQFAKRQRGERKPYEIAFTRKDKKQICTLVSPQPLFDREGRFECSFAVVTDITELKEAEMLVKLEKKKQEAKSKKLEELNTALKVLLEKRSQDKEEFEQKMASNLRLLVEPYLEKLMNTTLDEEQRVYLDILRSYLNDIVSPFARRLSSGYYGLTRKEIDVALLIKEGKSTKDIAELLHSSVRAVEFHRETLRKKFGLTNKKTSLRAHLLSLS